MSRPENELDLDQAALAADAAAVELPENATPPSGADQAPGSAPGLDQPGPPPASWAPLTPGLVVAIDIAVCPNWKLTGEEKTALADALAPALDQLFPGGLGDERWAPYFRLLAVTVAIAGARFDSQAFRFKPLRAKKSAGPGEEGAPPAAAPQDSSFTAAAPGARQ